MPKFKNKKGKIIEVRTEYDANILRNNPNYTELKEKEPKEDKSTLKTEKGSEVAKKPL